jgi:hypothetical protein
MRGKEKISILGGNRTEPNIDIRRKLKISITHRNGQILTLMIEMI